MLRKIIIFFLLLAHCNLILGAADVPVCVCEFVAGKSHSLFGVSLGDGLIGCGCDKQCVIALKSSFNLPVGNVVIRNLSKDGKLTLFSQVSFLLLLSLFSGEFPFKRFNPFDLFLLAASRQFPF